MSEYEMMEMDDVKAKSESMFNIDPDAFRLDYSDNPEANQMFNANGGNPNIADTEENINALLVHQSDNLVQEPKVYTRRPHPKMSWIFTRGLGARIKSPAGHMVRCCVGDCGRLYVTNNGSTSAFKKHLEKVHDLVEFPDQARPRISAAKPDESAPKNKKTHSTRKTRMLNGNQVQNEAHLTQERPLLPLPVAQDGQLLNLLQYGGTPVSRELMMPPSTTADARDNLTRFRKILRELISTQVSLSLSVDRWTNSQSEDVLCVSAHFITDRWEPREVLLDMYIKKDMTGVEAATVLMNAIDGYGASSLVTTITTDYSPMMMLMMEQLGRTADSRADFNLNPTTDHIPCLSYIINSAANGALLLGEQTTEGSIMEKLGKVRLGINSIRQSHHALGVYQSLFALNMQPHLGLIVDESLRWDLTYEMVERLLAVHTIYNETCNNCGMTELMLTQEDMELLEEIKNLLGPLKAFAVRISTQRCPTITQTLPVYDKVLQYLKGTGQNKPAFIQQAYQHAHHVFYAHFGKSSANINFAFAPVIDPRMKMLNWVSPTYSQEDAEALTTLVQNFWEKNHSKTQQSSRLDDFPQSSFDTIFEVDHISMPDDLSRYLREPVVSSKIPYDNAVYDFWKSNAQLYPQLSCIARRFLPIPVTSMPCGRQLVYNRHLVSSASKDPEVSQMVCEFSLLHSWRNILT